MSDHIASLMPGGDDYVSPLGGQVPRAMAMGDPLEDNEPVESPPTTPLEQVQSGLSPSGREQVLKFAHEHGLPTDDPIFQLLSIVRENDIRANERFNREEELANRVLAAIDRAPDQLISACSNINLVAAEQGRGVKEAIKASEEGVKLAEEGIKLVKTINLREWILIGSAGISLILSASMLLIGINTLGDAKALIDTRAEHDDLAIKVISTAWERSLILSEQAFLRSEFTVLKAKEAQGATLTDGDRERVTDIHKRWNAVDVTSKALEQKEENLREELKNL